MFVPAPPITQPQLPCIVLLTRLTDECAPLLGDDTSATMMQDCCEILAEMNGEELRCFCKEDVLERLGTQIRPVTLLAPFL